VIASISVVGVVLVSALLVIPAATAKLLARSLGRMFVLAPLLGVASVLAGLVVSYRLDAPCMSGAKDEPVLVQRPVDHR